MCPGDSAGDRTEALVGFAAPSETLVEHEYLVGFAMPFSKQLRALAEPGCPWHRSRAVGLVGFPQKLYRLGVEAAKRLCRNSIGNSPDKELTASMARRFTAPQTAPLLLQLSASAIG